VDDAADDAAPGELTVGELAARTGVREATLRTWETRYGFPRPRRRPGGHRRYRDRDVTLIEQVLRLREAGVSLPAAIAQVTADAVQLEPSVYAGLRRRHPELQPQVLRKSTALALTRAIEDECCARAERPLLFGSFQEARYFRGSAARWRDLARTARLTVVFAEFDGVATSAPEVAAGSLITLPLPADAPLRREWSLVCESSQYPACLSGWELPGQHGVADADRRFEVVWTLDPAAVRDAALICALLAEHLSPGLRLTRLLPPGPPPPASADLRRATGLLTRMTGYLEGAVSPTPA
jgi:MerR family transcriptional regulator, light-induced transcriptional regulator